MHLLQLAPDTCFKVCLAEQTCMHFNYVHVSLTLLFSLEESNSQTVSPELDPKQYSSI